MPFGAFGVLLPVLFCVIALAACGGGVSHGGALTSAASASGNAAPEAGAPRLDIPQPAALLSDSAKVRFVAERYWDNFDWSDEAWISDTTALEGTFTPWAQVLAALPESDAAVLSGALFRRGNGHPAMQLRLLDVAEYFWHHPNSPFRSEELYIPVLEAVVAAPGIDTLYKLRPQAQLASALKNRPETKAAEISYIMGSGSAGRLSALRAEYTLVMFYNPGCPECARIEAYVSQSEIFGPLLSSGRLKVLAVYPDEDVDAWRAHLPQMPAGWIVGRSYMAKGGTGAYDLPAIPALYLLDRSKRVLVKDRPVEVIEAWLGRNA